MLKKQGFYFFYFTLFYLLHLKNKRALDSTNFKENRDGTFLWKGNRFKDGYLIKTMNLKSIVSKIKIFFLFIYEIIYNNERIL